MENRDKHATMSGDRGSEIVHRELDTTRQSPAVEVAEIVADLDGRDVADLATIWDCIDDMLANVFSEPPDPEAQVEVTFSYEGYRITVEQNGHAEFVSIA